ncbi:MAG: hypothetical protein KJ799_18430 [Bacteroidetes bacterium]|nr:hypothetical protein [Bacteroidota bacterium]MBU1678355.1 hypothetical protein [Bacteroidota bacterium]MBU2508674.1 hypothetical protein [Bacteroidota bacterium]
MVNNNKFRNTVGWITILSGIVAFISYFLVAASVNFNFDFFSNPVIIFSIPDVHIGMLRWSMIADIFGYYLLLLPALFFIHEWLLGKTDWRNLITFCGTSYILVGAVGASILALTWPSFLTKFPISSAEQQETIKLLFDSFSQMVGGGLWNLFDTIVGGVWWIGIGIFIKREKLFLGWFTIIVGVISLLDGFGNMLEINALAETALNLFLVLAPTWAVTIGIAILKNKIPLLNK